MQVLNVKLDDKIVNRLKVKIQNNLEIASNLEGQEIVTNSGLARRIYHAQNLTICHRELAIIHELYKQASELQSGFLIKDPLDYQLTKQLIARVNEEQDRYKLVKNITGKENNLSMDFIEGELEVYIDDNKLKINDDYELISSSNEILLKKKFAANAKIQISCKFLQPVRFEQAELSFQKQLNNIYQIDELKLIELIL